MMYLEYEPEEIDVNAPKKGMPKIIFTPEMIQNAAILSGQGLTFGQIADFFGIQRQTFTKKARENRELAEALMKGKSKMIAFVAGQLIQQIKAGSTAATIFYLKTQAGWRYADENNNSIGNFNAIEEESNQLELTTNDPNEAAKIYQQIMLRGKA